MLVATSETIFYAAAASMFDAMASIDPKVELKLSSLSWSSLLSFFIVSAIFILLYFPSYIISIRVAAAHLPEEDKAIVAFDRTFSGVFQPSSTSLQLKAHLLALISLWRLVDRKVYRQVMRIMVKPG